MKTAWLEIKYRRLKMINLKLIHGFQVWIIKEAGAIQYLYAIKINGGKKYDRTNRTQ